MTTKLKIIIGFLLMILLLGGMAGLGYIDLQKASDGFIDFRRQARVNIGASDMLASLNLSTSRTFAFTTSFDPTEIDRAGQAVEQFEKLAAAALEETQIQYRRDALQAAIKQIQTVKTLQGNVRGNLLEMRRLYNDVVRKSYNIMSDNLRELGSAAVRLQNYDAMYVLTKIWEEFSHCLSSLGRFAYSFDEKDGKAAMERISGVAPELKELQDLLVSEGGRKMYADLASAHKVLLEAVTSMMASGDASRASLAEMRENTRALQTTLTDFGARVDAERREVGTATLDSNALAQKMMLIISFIGIVLGAALAAFIIIGLVRVLNDISHFAEATARGDFSYQVRTREKGEIGVMVQSMQAIPAALKEILTEYKKLEESIEYGTMQAQGDAAKFSGDFATLVRGTNAILGRFLLVLESIPSPVVILDKDLKASYLNTIARELAGADYKGKTCFQLFAREDFDSSTDALKIAVESKKPAHGETKAHPQGKHLDISYNAIPMFDEQHQLAAVMQLITDLTAIKTQQRTMMDVAQQASEISNRVAAASEELSAQVEQVSRGAEMQRGRVESTASAMTEMNSTVLEVARSAGEASEQSEKTRQKAHDGAGLVNQVVNAINLVNRVAMTLQSNMKELGIQAESIGGVMNVISDIADQTNLLALNAAIEAARAGEAGRGFAVVADEVRKLAEKTMSATHEVGSSIMAIQNSAKVNIEEVSSAVKSITDATELANSSGTALGEIVDLASANSAVVASIATAAEEQSATSEEINRAIEEINQVVGETTEGMIQSSSAVQELSHMAQELRRVMDGLK